MKTLKDINESESMFYFKDELRKSAIEWIKYFENDYNGVESLRHKNNQNTINWIKHFFGIDEDLNEMLRAEHEGDKNW